VTRALLALALFFALPAAACSTAGSDSPAASITPNPVIPNNESLLFIARGPAKAGGGHLTIDTTHVEWFTDRPDRRAGFTTLDTFAALWQNTFANDPPTAAIAGIEIDAVITVQSATVTDKGVDLAYTPVRSDLADGDIGPVTLFIDSSTSPTGCDAVGISFGQNRQVILSAGSDAFKNNDVINVFWNENAQSSTDQDTLFGVPGITLRSSHTYSAGFWQPSILGSNGCTRSWSLDCNGTVCKEQ
jgi:hypothetical protein